MKRGSRSAKSQSFENVPNLLVGHEKRDHLRIQKDPFITPSVPLSSALHRYLWKSFPEAFTGLLDPIIGWLKVLKETNLTIRRYNFTVALFDMY